MLKIVTSQQMREMDGHTINELGVPGVVLMENAGVGTFRVVRDYLPKDKTPLVYVFSGKGNNGGDGFVVARHLWDSGVDVRVFVAGTETDLKGDALINYRAIKNFGLDIQFLTDKEALTKATHRVPDLIVDALLGTGIKGAVHGFMKAVIQQINRLGCPVIAVDVPSGINADSALVEGEAVRAIATVTMALPKRAHLFYPAREYVGKLFIADIGIPHTVRNAHTVPMQLVEKKDIRLPQRSGDAHKYRVGKVAVLAGSPGYTGAAALASEAALRAGAGLVILAVPQELNPILETKLTEVITRPYPTGGKAVLTPQSLDSLEDLFEWCDVLAIGPGLGRSADTQKAIATLLSGFEKPAVIDADALFALSVHSDLWLKPHPNWILTPHHGEFLRLVPHIKKENFQRDYPDIARQFAMDHQLTLLLKGAPSLLAGADGMVFVNSTGNPGLASGGTGDVLTGLVAGLRAQGLDAAAAGYTASFLHGFCADFLAKEETVYSLTAGDLIAALGKILTEFV